MKKRVLIVSYTFPPAPGIGGRRWVKFAKYLKRNGHRVKILTARSQEDSKSEWIKDYEEVKEDVHFIPSSYPKYLGITPETLSQKVLYKLALLYAKCFSRGNYYDKSNYWEKKLLNACRGIIISEDINNVVCTVGPFRSAYFLLTLKKEFPKINLIIDYRDPWTNNETSFGFTGLSKKRFEFELEMEKEVIRKADKLTAVSKEMGNHFKKFLKEDAFEQKFHTLPNGFDPEDFETKSSTSRYLENGKINIVFAGTFYTRSLHVFEQLIKTITRLEEQFPEKKGILCFTFVGSITDEIKPYFKKYPHLLNFIGKKRLAETYAIIDDADACALFLTDDLDYSFSTKFYEYLGRGKKILSFAKHKGNNAAFIEENNLGLAISVDTMEVSIKEILLNQKLSKLEKTIKFNSDLYSIKTLTKKLESQLIP